MTQGAALLRENLLLLCAILNAAIESQFYTTPKVAHLRTVQTERHKAGSRAGIQDLPSGRGTSRNNTVTPSSSSPADESTSVSTPEISLEEITKDRARKETGDNVCDDDCVDTSNTRSVPEYSDEIISYMRELEEGMRPNANYMDDQAHINWSDRSGLIDWLVKIHQYLSLLPETLFLFVNYIDRFLSKERIELERLQLVGVTGVLLAAKHERRRHPSLKTLLYVTGNKNYSVSDIQEAELRMLIVLDYKIGWPGPMVFLWSISEAAGHQLETTNLSLYLLEITIMDEIFVAEMPSFLAVAAYCLSRLILDGANQPFQSPSHICYLEYTYTQLRPVVSKLLVCYEFARNHHPAVFEKYSNKQFGHAARLVEEQMKRGFVLPEDPTRAANIKV